MKMKSRYLRVLSLLFGGLAATQVVAQSTEQIHAIEIAGVYGAQSHVIDLRDPTYPTLVKNGQGQLQEVFQETFPLVADRDVLFKVNLKETAGVDTRVEDIDVSLFLELPGRSETFSMSKPLNQFIDNNFPTERERVQHSFDNSYTVVVDKSLIRQGLQWSVGWCHRGLEEAANCGISESYEAEVRPPIRMHANLFPIELFGWRWNKVHVDFDILFDEIAEKMPISELVLNRPETDYHKLSELLIHPQADNPPQLIKHRKDNGGNVLWGQENESMRHIVTALAEAGGRDYADYSHQMLVMGQNSPRQKGIGGTNSMFRAVMSRRSGYGLVWHENLHMYGLGHYGNGNSGKDFYPYIGNYRGIPNPVKNGNQLRGHNGPAWGYDSRFEVFLPPTTTRSGFKTWRVLPHNQGSTDRHGKFGMNLTPLSDWSAVHVMNYFAKRPAWYDKLRDSEWVEESGWHVYDKSLNKLVRTQPGIHRGFTIPAADAGPIPVNTLLFQASLATELMNWKGGKKVMDINPVAKIHAPIGPYLSVAQWNADPSKGTQHRNWVTDRNTCTERGSFCDFSVRVKIDGKWVWRALDRQIDLNPDNTKTWPVGTKVKILSDNFVTLALTVPVKEGEIEAAEFYLTPDVMHTPWDPASLKLLATWER